MGFGPTNNRRYSERHELELVRLYESCLSCGQIEDLTTVPQGSVWDILQRRGVKCRTSADYEPAQEPLDTVLMIRTAWLHEQGLTYAQIGEIMGLKPGGVCYRLRAAKDRLGYKGVTRGKNNRPKKTIPLHVRRAVALWAAEAKASASTAACT